MRFNVFEGARRIALSFAATFTIGCVAYGVFAEPHVAMTFVIRSPDAPAVSAARCGDEDATEFLTRELEGGKSVWVTLCFTAHKADDARMLVPYQTRTTDIRLPDGTIIEDVSRSLTRTELIARLKANGYDVAKFGYDVASLETDSGTPWEPHRVKYWRMHDRYSSEVRTYAGRVAAGFALSNDDSKEAERRLWSARVEQWKQAAQVMLVGLIVGWGLVALVGWVVRGFMGIPRGADRRPIP